MATRAVEKQQHGGDDDGQREQTAHHPAYDGTDIGPSAAAARDSVADGRRSRKAVVGGGQRLSGIGDIDHARPRIGGPTAAVIQNGDAEVAVRMAVR